MQIKVKLARLSSATRSSLCMCPKCAARSCCGGSSRQWCQWCQWCLMSLSVSRVSANVIELSLECQPAVIVGQIQPQGAVYLALPLSSSSPSPSPCSLDRHRSISISRTIRCGQRNRWQLCQSCDTDTRIALPYADHMRNRMKEMAEGGAERQEREIGVTGKKGKCHLVSLSLCNLRLSLSLSL